MDAVLVFNFFIFFLFQYSQFKKYSKYPPLERMNVTNKKKSISRYTIEDGKENEQSNERESQKYNL